MRDIRILLVLGMGVQHPRIPIESLAVSALHLRRLLPTEEIRIALPILPPTFGIISAGLKLFPGAGGINVLVPLVPPPINHFRQAGIIAIALELGVRNLLGLGLGTGGGCGKARRGVGVGCGIRRIWRR
jgi:hypothetical protein